MAGLPLITVITPVYNVEKYLAECLDSILSQTYTNLELILIDDASSDDSPWICDLYAEKDPRVTVYHIPHSGVAGARNVGLDHATGEYIFFMDSDDILVEDAIEKQYNASVKYNSGYVIGLLARIDENGAIFQDFEECEAQVLSEYDYWSIYFSKVNYRTITAKLFAATVWESLRFPSIMMHEDEALLHSIISRSNSIVISNIKTLYYRSNPSSLMHREFTLANLGLAHGLSNRIDYFISRKWFSHAMFSFGLGTRNIITAQQTLNINDPVIKNEINNMYQTYCELAKRMLPMAEKQSDRFRLNLYIRHKHIYSWLQRINSILFILKGGSE